MSESLASANAVNVCEEYCGPFSVTTISGNSSNANTDFKLFTIEAEEVLLKLAISKRADW